MDRSWTKSATLALALASFAALESAATTPRAAFAHPLLPGSALLAAAPVAQGEDPDEIYNRALDAQTANPPKIDLAIDLYGKAIKARKNFADAYYNRGLCYFKKQDYKSAVADFDQVTKLMPRGVDAYVNRALANLAGGNADAALADLNAAEQLPNLKADQKLAIGYQRAQIRTKKGDWAGAKKDWDAYLTAKPGDPVALFNRGLAETALNQFDAAAADFAAYIAKNPQDPNGYVSRGDSYVAAKKYDQAVADYAKYIQLKPEDPYGYSARAAAYYNLKQYDKALPDLDAFLAKNPTDKQAAANALSLRADANMTLKKYDAAIADYTKLVALDPKNADAIDGRAKANIAKGDFAAALKDYDAFIATNPTGKAANVAYYNRGVAFMQVKPADYEKAAADFSKAIAADPGDEASYNGRANAYINLKKWDLAAADLTKVISSGKPGSPEVLAAYKARGRAYQLAQAGGAGDNPKAAADYKAYLAAKPDDTQVKLWLADVDSGSDVIPVLTEAITKAGPTDPKLAGLYYDRGAAYYGKQKYGEAAADFEKSLAIKGAAVKPEDAETYGAAALAYSKVGTDAGNTRAAALYTKAIALNPAKSEYLLSRGDLNFAAKKYDEAAADYAAYAAKNPGKPEVQKDVARAYIAKGPAGADQAITALTAYTAAKPDDAEGFKGLGYAYYVKKDWPKAAAAYETYLGKKPDDAAAAQLAATAYLNANNIDKAIALYDKTLAAKPDAAAYLNRGIAYAKRADAARNEAPEKAAADYDKAVADYDKSIGLKPSAEAYYNKGNAIIKKNQATNGDAKELAPAVEAFQRFLAAAPNDPEAGRIKQLVADLQAKVSGG
jgi:tetratricopeptide (TPR) repeat protein